MSFINTAYAAGTNTATHAAANPGLASMLPYFLLIIALIYFFIIRPQSKRAKEQKNLMDAIRVGDEVVTIGGITGKVLKLRDNFVVITISNGTTITMQKNSISAQLPKGSFTE